MTYHRSIFLVNNIHCASCVDTIREVLSQVPNVGDVEVSILTHEVRVYHGEEAGPSILARSLIRAAFEVEHVTTYDSSGRIISDIDTAPLMSRSSIFLPSPRMSYSNMSEMLARPASKRFSHITNCNACREELIEGAASSSCRPEEDVASQVKERDFSGAQDFDQIQPDMKKSVHSLKVMEVEDGRPSSDSATITEPTKQRMSRLPAAPKQPEEYSARLSIGGMSCASCSNTITGQIKQLDFVRDITVTLLTNSAAVTYTGSKSNIDKIVEEIEDMGFEASTDEVTVVSPPSPVETVCVADISIGGMTCGSCVGAVTRGLEELPYVVNVSVNLLSHSGQVIFEGQKNLDHIVQTIEDLGYDASVSSLHLPNAGAGDDSYGKATSRTVCIRVDGMFCHHCPESVLACLDNFSDVSLNVEEPLSIKDPILKITYTPRPPAFTIRDILSAIEATNDSFKATIHHPPSIEDRSRAMQHRERGRLLSRLLFVLAVAIPTFIIGIVYMSLVPSSNKTRKYLEQPIWAGSVNRIEWSLFIMATPVMFYGTDAFHVRAMKEVYALWRPGSRAPILRRFYRFGSMNLLISAGTTVAYFASLAILIMDAVTTNPTGNHTSTYFDSVVFLTLFILAGRYMEAYSKAKTGDAVTSLGKLRPSEALLVESPASVNEENEAGGVRKTAIDHLEVGDIVNVPHGTSPPMDGIIIGDNAYQFDESSLTGESRPVKKTAGDQVFTGSVNIARPVQIEVTEITGSSMLDRIIAVVREGQTKRAPLERIADLMTAHFVPAITLIAILTFIIWLSLGQSGVLPADYLDVIHGGWAFWSLEFAIAVFVVACPCGLALAAPTALFVGSGLAAKHGILVKGGGEAFQEASRLNAIVFDKTGTLTEGGSLKVSDHEVLATEPEEVDVAWALARKLEENSNHPLAEAIVKFCNGEKSSSVTADCDDIHEISGHGMKGVFTVSNANRPAVKYEAAIGNERLLHSLESSDVDTYYLSTLLSRYQTAGKSTAILSLRRIDDDGKHSFHPAIVFATSDLIRPESAPVISELQDRGVDVYMCTGDNQTTAYAVADMLGISRSRVLANVLPTEKANFIRRVQGDNSTIDNDNTSPPSSQSNEQDDKKNKESRPIVAFVGDGVNDSPALAVADVSIAMASGSDVAINSASFILLNSDVSTILQLVVLSRRVFNRVRLNFCWAVVYNICLVPISAGVLYPIVNGQKHETMTHEDGSTTTITVNKHWRLGPVWAALAMALSSVSVVSSSLALRVEIRSGLKRMLGFGRRRTTN